MNKSTQFYIRMQNTEIDRFAVKLLSYLRYNSEIFLFMFKLLNMKLRLSISYCRNVSEWARPSFTTLKFKFVVQPSFLWSNCITQIFHTVILYLFIFILEVYLTLFFVHSACKFTKEIESHF